MEDIKLINEVVHGTKGIMVPTNERTKQAQIMHSDGSTKEITFYPIKYCKDIKTNLLFLTAKKSADWKIMRRFKQHYLTKDHIGLLSQYCSADVNCSSLDWQLFCQYQLLS